MSQLFSLGKSGGGRDVSIPDAKDAVLKGRTVAEAVLRQMQLIVLHQGDAADSHAMNQASSSPMLIPSRSLAKAKSSSSMVAHHENR